MPKIKVENARTPDKTGDALRSQDEWFKTHQKTLDNCINDLLFVQNHPKLYINEKKQLQHFIMDLYELDYYDTHKTAMDKIGLM